MSTDVRKGLLRKASMNKELAARVLPLFKGAAATGGGMMLTAEQHRNLVDVIRMVRGIKEAAKAAPAETLTKLPGFSPMQMRQKIDQVADLRQQIVTLQKQFETVIAQVGQLEADEKKGLDELKDAAKELGKKGKFLIEAEHAMLEWTAYFQEKRPGIEQMIATPDDPEVQKKGLKAGDLFGRIAAKLGEEVSKQVQALYTECSEDLTVTALAIKGLKIVAKSSSLHPEIMKSAGIMDAFQGVRQWLSGKVSPLLARVLGIRETVANWAKGFVTRTKKVETAADALKAAIADAQKNLNKAIADYGDTSSPGLFDRYEAGRMAAQKKSPTTQGAKALYEAYRKGLKDPGKSKVRWEDFYDRDGAKKQDGKKDEGWKQFVPDKSLARSLGQWHESISDPIFAVSSNATSGKPIPVEVAKKAIKKIQELLDREQVGTNPLAVYKMTKEDKAQLSSAKKTLEKNLAQAEAGGVKSKGKAMKKKTLPSGAEIKTPK
jgi:hypothetical protein